MVAVLLFLAVATVAIGIPAGLIRGGIYLWRGGWRWAGIVLIVAGVVAMLWLIFLIFLA